MLNTQFCISKLRGTPISYSTTVMGCDIFKYTSYIYISREISIEHPSVGLAWLAQSREISSGRSLILDKNLNFLSVRIVSFSRRSCFLTAKLPWIFSLC